MDMIKAIALRRWGAAVVRYRSVEAAYWAASHKEQTAWATFDQTRPPMPDDVRQVLYFGEFNCPEGPTFVDRRTVRAWLKMSGLSLQERERLECQFVEWRSQCDELQFQLGRDRLSAWTAGLHEAKQAAYEAVIHIPAPDLDVLAEKISIAAELLDGFSLEAIREDVRRLAQTDC